MKNIIFILFVFISTSVVAQNTTGKQYIPWLKSDAITIPGPADDATQKGYFIWHGDTVDFSMLTDSTIVYEQDSTVLFVTLKQLIDSLNSLPGGHSPVTIGANGTTAGLTVTEQELNMQSATAARNGYLTSLDFSNFYNKLSSVAHNYTLTGSGTSIDPLKADTAVMAAKLWVLNQNYINENQLHWDSITNKPTIPTIEHNAFDGTWDGDLDGTDKNTIYDIISALPGGHDAVTLSDSALLGGLSLSGQILDFQRATSSQNGFITSVNFNKWETATTLSTAFTSTGKFTKSSASSGRAVEQAFLSEDANKNLTVGGRINVASDFGYSVGFGAGALYRDDKTNNYNIGLGHASLYNITSGSYNVGIGYDAGRFYGPDELAVNNSTSTYSIYIGTNTRPLANGGTNEIVIGNSALGNGSNTITLGNTDITNVYTSGKYNGLNGKFSALAGTGNRLVIADATGQFSAAKKDSITYWNNAYAKKLVSGAVTGGINKTITLNLNDGSTITMPFTDLNSSAASSFKLFSGSVTDRNIDVTYAGYTPSNGDQLVVLPDYSITEGDTITLSINGGTQYNIFEKTSCVDSLAMTLVFRNDVWYLLGSVGEEYVVTGTNTGDQVDTLFTTIAISDETTDLTTGTAKRTFRMPVGCTLIKVRANVVTAPTGSTLIFDINEGVSSVLSTKLSIDATEKTSVTAASQAVISDSNIADDAEMTIDIDQVGSTVAGAGAKIVLYYVKN